MRKNSVSFAKARANGLVASIFEILLILIPTYSLAIVLDGKLSRHSILYVAAAVILAIVFGQLKSTSKKYIYSDFIFGYIFSFALLTGTALENYALAEKILYIIPASIYGAFLFACVAPYLSNFLGKLCGSKLKLTFSPSADLKSYVFYVLFMYILWLPVLFAYYPGIFSYDIAGQLPQALSGTYNTHHPLVHTLFSYFFYEICALNGSHTTGIFIHSLFQMLCVAMALSYLLLFLKRSGAGCKWIIAVLIFFSIFPVFPLLAISTTKDIIFTAFFVVLCILYSYFSLDPGLFTKKRFSLLFVLSGLGMCFFRNTGIYILVLAFAVLLLITLLKHRDRNHFLFSGIHLTAVLLFFILNSALVNALDAAPGSKNEMLSIPYQQVACVHHYKESVLSPEEKAEIERFIPDVTNYWPQCADSIKATGTATEDFQEFIKLYIHLFKDSPACYLEAFLKTNQGYWYVDDTWSSRIYGEGANTRNGYMSTGHRDGFDVIHISFFPSLENLYERLFSANEYRDYPIISCIFSISVYFWLVVLATIHLFAKKDFSVILPFSMVWFLILTLFAGPCAIVRYAFPYICVTPLLLSLSFTDKEKTLAPEKV